MCFPSVVADDWIVKGCHIHADGIEPAVRSDHIGGVMFFGVFSAPDEVAVQAAIRRRFQLPRSSAPQLEQFGKEFLESIRHPNTKKHYATSVANLQAHFGDTKLSGITAERIDEFKEATKVRTATVNRDLAVLRRMLR